MKVSLIIIGSLLIFSQSVIAQEKTYGGSEEGLVKMHSGIGSLVVIPFDDRMYMSDADGPIGRETGLDPGELEIKFRNALLEALEDELSKDWEMKVVYDVEQRSDGFDLAYIHSSRKYNYEAVSDEVLMANDTTISKKDLRSNGNSKKTKSGVQNGQIVTTSDNRDKYMNLEITNDTLMQFLDRSMDSDYYLFINEMDIRHYVDDPSRIATGGLSYQLKVHFSCLDKKGKDLISGAATSKVKAENSNIYAVIKEGIPEITEKMAKMIRKKSLDKNQ